MRGKWINNLQLLSIQLYISSLVGNVLYNICTYFGLICSKKWGQWPGMTLAQPHFWLSTAQGCSEAGIQIHRQTWDSTWTCSQTLPTSHDAPPASCFWTYNTTPVFTTTWFWTYNTTPVFTTTCFRTYNTTLFTKLFLNLQHNTVY